MQRGQATREAVGFRVVVGAALVAVATVVFPIVLPVVAGGLLMYGLSLRRRPADAVAHKLAPWAITAGLLLMVASVVTLMGLMGLTSGTQVEQGRAGGMG